MRASRAAADLQVRELPGEGVAHRPRPRAPRARLTPPARRCGPGGRARRARRRRGAAPRRRRRCGGCAAGRGVDAQVRRRTGRAHRRGAVALHHRHHRAVPQQRLDRERHRGGGRLVEGRRPRQATGGRPVAVGVVDPQRLAAGAVVAQPHHRAGAVGGGQGAGALGGAGHRRPRPRVASRRPVSERRLSRTSIGHGLSAVRTAGSSPGGGATSSTRWPRRAVPERPLRQRADAARNRVISPRRARERTYHGRAQTTWRVRKPGCVAPPGAEPILHPSAAAAAIPRRLAQLPHLVEHEVIAEGIDPRHDGLRIVHMTDVHCGRITGAATCARRSRWPTACAPTSSP